MAMTTSDKWHHARGTSDAHTLKARDGNNILTGGSGYTWIELNFAKVLGGFTFDATDPLRWKQNPDGTWESGNGADYKYQRVWRDIDGDGAESAGDEYDYFTNVQAIRVFGSEGDDTMVGDGRDNSFYGRGDDDTLYGGDGEDYLYGGSGSNKLFGGAGDDVILGRSVSQAWEAPGNNYIDGGDGDDEISAGHGDDKIYGGAGDDLIEDYGGNNRIFGGAGNDSVFGGIGKDMLDGGSGDDDLSGNAGNDKLFGRRGDDYLYGDEGNDILRGGRDNDVLLGGAGNDLLNGQKGSDVMTGGAGNDIFVLLVQGGKTKDVITDFTSGEDKLDLRRHDGDVYMRQNGNELHLSKAVGKSPFAVLKAVSTLTASDFVNSDISLINMEDLDPLGPTGVVADVI
jgi:Ca2+-binding RTX toxin-like protein